MKIAKPLAAIAAWTLCSAAHATLVMTSDFNAGGGGWTGGGGLAAFAAVASGGVDGSGYVRTTDLAGGQMTLVSPALGNLSAALGGSFGFDYNVFSLGTGDHYIPNNEFGLVTIHSGGRYVSADLIPDVSVPANLVGSGWHAASLGLSNAAWSGNALLSDVLANVTSLSIVTEYDYTRIWPDEVVGIDSISFAAPSSRVVPEPGTDAMLLLGVAGLMVARRSRIRR